MDYALGFTSSLCLLMMLATVPIAYREARPRSSVAYGAGFLLLGIAIPLLLLPNTLLPRTLVLGMFMVMAGSGAACLWVGTWLRCGARVPYRFLLPLVLVWTLSLFWPPDRPELRFALSGLCTATGCFAAIFAILRGKPRRNAADRMLAATFLFAGLSELLLAALPLTQHASEAQLWGIRSSIMPLVLVGLGIFVLQSYALDSIDELNRLSETDPLTGLFNRRVFDERFALAIASAVRYRRPLSVVIADLDNFKLVNDTYGHAAGDEVLKVFARLLQHGSRSVDTVARIGGEEFAVIMPESSAADALGFAERLRLATERLVPTAGASVTASFGVADTGEDRGDPRSLLASADAALYQAKAAGRNRVVGYPTEVQQASVSDAALRDVG